MTGGLDAGHGAGLERLAVHDGGVHLVLALGREDRAAAGVEERIVLEHMHGGLDGVHGRATRVQHLGSGLGRLVEPGAIGGIGLRSELGAVNHPRPAMHHQRPRVRRRRRRRGRFCVFGLLGQRGNTHCHHSYQKTANAHHRTPLLCRRLRKHRVEEPREAWKQRPIQEDHPAGAEAHILFYRPLRHDGKAWPFQAGLMQRIVWVRPVGMRPCFPTQTAKSAVWMGHPWSCPMGPDYSVARFPGSSVP
jgi:hypothetical protein